MNVYKKHIYRIILTIVTIQLLNLSIYAQDFKPFYPNDDKGNVNISESISEYVVEIILGHKNAIPEQTQHHKDLHFHKHPSFKALNNLTLTYLPEIPLSITKTSVPIQENYEYQFCQEINPPPPKA